MGTVTVYRFKKFDIVSDCFQFSRRWGTPEAIAAVDCTIIREQSAEVDVSVLGPEIPGMTAMDFNPHQRTGFQTSVPLDRR